MPKPFVYYWTSLGYVMASLSAKLPLIYMLDDPWTTTLYTGKVSLLL